VSRRTLVPIIVGLLVAAGCVRLGIWQLDRLAQRRARNAVVAARLDGAPLRLTALPRDTALARYRRVQLAGRYDYAHEIVLAGRSLEGSPGVNLVTPLRVAGSDTAVLVNRGWVYSPDGASAEPARWRESDSLDGTGWVVPLAAPLARQAGSPTHAPALRWLDRAEVQRRTGYPVLPFEVRLLEETPATSRRTPARLPPPPLDDGPHLGYAIQWFSFAVIAIVGAGVLARNERRRHTPISPHHG
jgi:surfeit locus 1 family protein